MNVSQIDWDKPYTMSEWCDDEKKDDIVKVRQGLTVLLREINDAKDLLTIEKEVNDDEYNELDEADNDDE